MKTILIVNGSLAGKGGNTDRLLARMEPTLVKAGCRVEQLVLAEGSDWARQRDVFAAADGFLFGTGTYWDSWSSHLQRFLEETSDWEGSAVWLGKPAGVLVTGHEAGAKGVLSRLEGVLVTLGCLIPPMSGMVYTHLHQIAYEQPGMDPTLFWNELDHRDVAAHNLAEAVLGTHGWRAWNTDLEYRKVWIK